MMPTEITIKDLYDIIDKRFTRLEGNIEKYHDTFIRFEEGKLTQALQDIEKVKGEVKVLQTQNIRQDEQNVRQDDVNARNIEKRKDWIWGALEKVIFMLIIPLIGLILIRLGIINLSS